ncbi:hypothetical protein K5M36_04525 [Chromobacterium vaccinii]|nr:hypothetical protein [Chromobacterium vaccinii]
MKNLLNPILPFLLAMALNSLPTHAAPPQYSSTMAQLDAIMREAAEQFASTPEIARKQAQCLQLPTEVDSHIPGCPLQFMDSYSISSIPVGRLLPGKRGSILSILDKKNGIAEFGIFYPDGQARLDKVVIRTGQSAQYTVRDDQGRKLVSYSIGNSLFNGRWQQWDENGRKVADGNYQNDLENGRWRNWNESGELVQDATYRGGVEISGWKILANYQQKFVWKMVPAGRQQEIYQQDKEGRYWLKRREIVGDKPDTRLSQQGEITTWHPNGQMASHYYSQNGKWYGPYETWYENGKKQELCHYIDGDKNGKSEQWYENGQMSASDDYRNGKQQGPSLAWHQNGQKRWEVSYQNGKREGLYQFWNDHGFLVSRVIYQAGNMEGWEKVWFKPGQLKSETMYKNGKKHGRERIWQDNGQLWADTQYVDGQAEGLAVNYRENGQKKSEYTFAHGIENGPARFWDEQGKLYRETIYRNGISGDSQL